MKKIYLCLWEIVFCVSFCLVTAYAGADRGVRKPHRSSTYLCVCSAETSELFMYRADTLGRLRTVYLYPDRLEGHYNAVFDNVGHFLYAATTHGGLESFKVEQNGSIKPLFSHPIPLQQGDGVCSVAISSQHRCVYMAGADYVAQFRIQKNGTLRALTRPMMTSQQIARTYVASGDRSLYTVDAEGTISQFHIRRNGEVRRLHPPFVPVNQHLNALTVDPRGSFLFAINEYWPKFPNSGSVSRYRIRRDGTLKALRPSLKFSDIAPEWITIDPRGKFVYILAGNAALRYRMRSDGRLIFENSTSVPDPEQIAIEPKGKFAYICSTDSIREYRILSNGNLRLLESKSMPVLEYPVIVLAAF